MPNKSDIAIIFKSGLQKTGKSLIAFFLTSILFQSIGFYLLFEQHYFDNSAYYWFLSIINEFFFTSILALLLIVFYFFVTKEWIFRVINILLSLLIVFQLASLYYFMITLEPIGSTLFEFDPDQMGMIASNFVIFKWYYLLLLLPPFVYFLFLRVFRNNKLFNLIAVIFLVASVGAISFDFQIKQAGEGYRSGDLIQNKTYFLITSLLEKSNYENLSSYEKAIVRYQQLEKNKAFINQEFPFIHKRSNKNTLAPFFDLKETPPNIVFIIVESLSSSYSGKNADEISFTPFLDSLEEHSIYFENMLATGERTFSVLPNVIGSLPHGKKGFTNTKNSFPTHISLANWIFENNYEGAFYYGGYARFDHMDLYMNHEGFDPIFDRKEYNYEDKDVKTSIDPVPFGVGDRELFKNVIKYSDSMNRNRPYLDVILTLSMHYPFMIEEKEHYTNLAQKIVESNNHLSQQSKEKNQKYIEPFATMLYTDDAIKAYFKERMKRESHDNTIYFIFGDHMMGDIPQDNPIEKYRVPMLVYSPLLMRAKRVRAVNSQMDLPPSIMNLIGDEYDIPLPDKVNWLGESLDTGNVLNNQRNILFMGNNRRCIDFLSGEWFIHNNELYSIENRLKLNAEENQNKLDEMSKDRSFYEKLHSEVVTRNKLFPQDKQGGLLFTNQAKIMQFNDTIEFVGIQDQILEKDYKNIQIELKISLENGWTNSEKKQPMLICSISRDGERFFWEHLDFELNEKPTNEPRNMVLNLEDNVNMKLKEGDKISLYFWSNETDEKDYRLVIDQLHITGKTE